VSHQQDLNSVDHADGLPARFAFDLAILDRYVKWIVEDLQAIEGAVDALLRSSGIDARAVDRVFLTGGSSFVPAVRRIFSNRFGKEKIRGGHEFTSVAHGLALRALEEW